MFPDYVEVQVPLGGFYMEAGDTARAVELFRALAARAPGDPEVRYYRGVTLLFEDSLAAGLQELDAAIALDPNFVQPYYAAYVTLTQVGQRERALRYLERWLALHPDDAQVRALLEAERPSTGAGPRGSVLPPPPQVQLP
jgi:tetratricopeptide (TPR) repeat protein